MITHTPRCFVQIDIIEKVRDLVVIVEKRESPKKSRRDFYENFPNLTTVIRDSLIIIIYFIRYSARSNFYLFVAL